MNLLSPRALIKKTIRLKQYRILLTKGQILWPLILNADEKYNLVGLFPTNSLFSALFEYPVPIENQFRQFYAFFRWLIVNIWNAKRSKIIRSFEWSRSLRIRIAQADSKILREQNAFGNARIEVL
jgi:hypothetical protein